MLLCVLGQFYAISFEGNVSPPPTDGEIERVRVGILAFICYNCYTLVTDNLLINHVILLFTSLLLSFELVFKVWDVAQ